MELLIINDNPYGQNIYIYFDKETREGIIIDPGDSYETVREAVEQNKIAVKAILLTHGHFDHTFCANNLKVLTNAPIYAHENETNLLRNTEHNRSGLRSLEISVAPDKHFKDGDVFSFANCEIKVIHTPGHTAGGVCYYDENAGIVFTGDTLFKETIGRTDMPTGDYETLLSSIREKLFTLPEEVKVFPGHDESSTIKHEKKFNRIVGV
ncbi:MAG: MBL fold metallo-hydrolase [Clostridiales bacterium]|jgi:glyoxylase-like metal-dependent hydrolase (beta-lactamase superfamily II)|nr:MBL fold metallo-hydrolase [Clostridiales bacterium]